MPRKAEAPKGEVFLPGVSAEELRTMPKQAPNGIDSIRYMAMHMRKIGWEIGMIATGLGRTAETIRRWLTLAHREGIDSVPHVKKGAPCRLSVESSAASWPTTSLLRSRSTTGSRAARGTTRRSCSTSRKSSA